MLITIMNDKRKREKRKREKREEMSVSVIILNYYSTPNIHQPS